VYFQKIAGISTVLEVFPTKICRKDNFYKYSLFLSTDGQKTFEIFIKYLLNLGVLHLENLRDLATPKWL
jgi:hypothetical protein